LSIQTVASVATLQLNVVRVSAGELSESVAYVLKGFIDLGQLDVSIEIVTGIAHVTEELHDSIQNELDDVDGDVDVDELEDGVGRGVEKFGDDGSGRLVPNDLALELGVATRGHVVVLGCGLR
jgi:hypothetical protein